MKIVLQIVLQIVNKESNVRILLHTEKDILLENKDFLHTQKQEYAPRHGNIHIIHVSKSCTYHVVGKALNSGLTLQLNC